MLSQVEHLRHVNVLKDHYIQLFKGLYGRGPIFKEKDQIDFKWAVDVLGIEDAKELMTTYFASPNEWWKTQAYAMGIFRAQINQVIASGVKTHSVKKPVYVVAMTEDGTPVYSTDKNACKFRGESDDGRKTPNPFKPKLVES